MPLVQQLEEGRKTDVEGCRDMQASGVLQLFALFAIL